MKRVKIKDFVVGDKEALWITAGPCVIESLDHALFCASKLKTIFSHHWINFTFKSSYDKANRLSHTSFRGPGLDAGLEILKRVREEFDISVVTDVHSPAEARAAAEVCDIVQIPALLCRQTDLVLAAAQSAKAIQIKRGQFLPPSDMKYIIEKAESCSNQNIILVERGSCFGYEIISDMRSIPIMQRLDYPVIFDASHTSQIPGALQGSSGGDRSYVAPLAKAALAAGANGLFIETHPNPDKAPCDGKSMIDFDQLEKLLTQLEQLFATISNW